MGTVRSRQFSWIALLAAALLIVSGLLTPAQAATKRAISIAIKPTTSYAGAAVTVSGKISRSPKGTVVRIQRKAGKKWVAVASTKTTNAAGNYFRPVTLPKVAGTYSFRAIANKTKKLRGATSRTVKVLALRKVTATLNVSAPIIQLHQKVKLSGKVSPALAGKVLFIQRLDGLRWIDFITATINKTGAYEREFTPDADTTYRVRVPRNGLYAGTYSAIRKVTVSNGPISPVITTTSLPTGGVGSAYSSPLAVTTSLPAKPGTWAVASGSLPAGLTLSSAGVISGTPTGTGTSSFTVIYTEKTSPTASLSDTQALSITVYAQPTITTSVLPNGVKGATYSQQLARSGGSGGGTWSVVSGILPAGLTLSTGGLLSGTTSTVGSSSFVVRFTDAVDGLNAPTKNLSVDVFDGPVITTSSLPFGIKGQTYSQQLTASGGSGSGTWSVASGALPAGLTLSAGGLISGTPSGAADAAFTVRFTDSGAGLTPATKALSIKVYSQPAITTSILPSGFEGEAYSQQLAVTGGSGSGTWSVDSGTLPSGVTLSLGGLLSGTPTVVGTSTFTVRFADTIGGLVSPTKQFELRVLGDPSITTSALPFGVKGAPYSQQLAVAGGSGAGTWSIVSGALPAGLTLSGAGLIAGTPTTEVNSLFTVQFVDAAPGLTTASKALGIRVYAQPTISTASLPNALIAAPYNAQLVVAGGSGSGTWSVASGSLPAGLSLSGGGVISGTVNESASGSFPVTVRFTDDVNGLNSPTRSLSIQVYTRPTITTSGLPDVLRGSTSQYSAQLVATGGSGPGIWSLQAGSLPSGISLSAAGKLTGTSSTDGDYAFTVQFTDSVTGASATKSLMLHVGPVAIKTVSLPVGTVGSAYSTTMDGSPNNLIPSGWSISAGSLPSGLSLSGAGVLSGTPSVAGDYTFTISYSVLLKGTRNRVFTLRVNPAG